MNNPEQRSKFTNERRHGQLHGHVTPPKETHFIGAGTMHTGQGMSVDLTELTQALAHLATVADEFDEHAASAATLPPVLPAGIGPIGDALGQRFNHRLGEHGGLRYATTVMRGQVRAIQETLATTTQRYAETEDAAANNFAAISDPAEAI